MPANYARRVVDVTVISDDVRTLEGSAADNRLLVDPAKLSDALGWELKPEGLCRDDVCVPVRDRADLFVGDELDLEAVATALGRPVVVDADARVAAIALDGEARRRALTELTAPPFTLPDLDGNLHAFEEWHNQKKLLVAFASW
jgi:hypothetical protein